MQNSRELVEYYPTHRYIVSDVVQSDELNTIISHQNLCMHIFQLEIQFCVKGPEICRYIYNSGREKITKFEGVFVCMCHLFA